MRAHRGGQAAVRDWFRRWRLEPRRYSISSPENVSCWPILLKSSRWRSVVVRADGLERRSERRWGQRALRWRAAALAGWSVLRVCGDIARSRLSAARSFSASKRAGAILGQSSGSPGIASIGRIRSTTPPSELDDIGFCGRDTFGFRSHGLERSCRHLQLRIDGVVVLIWIVVK
jgi:hypothetical protein